MINKISTTSKINFVFFLGFLIFSFQSCLSPRDKSIREWEKREWSVVKIDKNDNPTWTISMRKLDETNFMEYKIEGTIESSPKACVASFRQEIHDQAKDLNNKKYPTYEVVEESTDSLLTYVIHKEPFPFKNTEMSIRYLFFQDLESTLEGVKWKEAWEENSLPPLHKKLSRVQTFRGSWQFISINNQHCKAVNIVQFDPKKMPQWLVKPMVTRFLIDGLQNIREMSARDSFKEQSFHLMTKDSN